MSYHCGIGPGIPMIPPRDSRVVCDGCGRAIECMRRDGLPKAWHLENVAPPRWKLVRDEDGRKDYCDRCKKGKR